jgi:hypothetical protein
MIKKRYDAIDLAKWFCSFLVIYIHASPVLDQSPFWEKFMREGICRVAVPFFLGISAFFLFAKMQNHRSGHKRNIQVIFRFCKHILLMYFTWSLIYVAYDLFYRHYNGAALCKPSVYIWKFWFQGSNIHLWYLIASVYAVFIVYGLWCAGRPALIIACVLGCTLQCLETPYRWRFLYNILQMKLLTDEYLAVFRTFSMAVPLMCLGILCLQDHTKKTSKQWLARVAVAAILYVMEIVVVFLIYRDKMLVELLLTGVLLVYYLINWLCVAEFSLPGNFIAKALRLNSTWNYCVHMLVLMLFHWFFAYNGFKRYVIVCCLTVMSGIPYIVIKLLLAKHKKKKKR